MAAAAAFIQGSRPEGLGLGWLGPDWVANVVSFGAFMLFAAWFVKRVR